MWFNLYGMRVVWNQEAKPFAYLYHALTIWSDLRTLRQSLTTVALRTTYILHAFKYFLRYFYYICAAGGYSIRWEVCNYYIFNFAWSGLALQLKYYIGIVFPHVSYCYEMMVPVYQPQILAPENIWQDTYINGLADICLTLNWIVNFCQE